MSVTLRAVPGRHILTDTLTGQDLLTTEAGEVYARSLIERINAALLREEEEEAALVAELEAIRDLPR